jgi:hypothetical protein
LPIGGGTRQVRVRHDRAQLQESPRRSSASRRGIRMRRIRPHPLESRALSSWGVSRSESLTSKPIGRLPASSVSRQIAKDFVKSLSGPKGDEGPEAQREGLPDCEDLRAILALQRGRAQQLWRGRQDPNPTLRVVAEPLTAARDASAIMVSAYCADGLSTLRILETMDQPANAKPAPRDPGAAEPLRKIEY